MLTALRVGLPRVHHYVARQQGGRACQPLVQIRLIPLQFGVLQGGGIGKGRRLGAGAIEHAVQARPHQVLARFGAVTEAALGGEKGLALSDAALGQRQRGGQQQGAGSEQLCVSHCVSYK